MHLKNKTDAFAGGNIKQFLPEWQKLTSDKYILDIVKYGLRIAFMEAPTICKPHPHPVSNLEIYYYNLENISIEI